MKINIGSGWNPKIQDEVLNVLGLQIINPSPTIEDIITHARYQGMEGYGERLTSLSFLAKDKNNGIWLVLPFTGGCEYNLLSDSD